MFIPAALKNRGGCDKLAWKRGRYFRINGGMSRGKKWTMKCKYCGEPLEEGVNYCMNCGMTQECETDTADKKKNTGLKVVIAVLAVLVVAVAAFLVYNFAAPAKEPAEEPIEIDGETITEVIPYDEATVSVVPEGTPSYTVTEEELTDDVLGKVIATCADTVLDNRELGIYYWQQYYTAAGSYGSYWSFMVDPSLPLDKQMYMDGTQTWQQFLLEGAMLNFHSVAAVGHEAAQAGYVLDAETAALVDGMAAELEQTAQAYGIADGDTYVKMGFGPTATVEQYVDFARRTMTASGYLRQLVEAEPYTEADIEAFYDEHAEEYASYGLQKTDKTNVHVRHVLIQPVETDENGEYTEAAWTQAESDMNAVVAEWEAGSKTEEAFGELAAAHSQDGNAAQGGLYENVYPGQMVAEFNDWCFDSARKVGDYGVVKTQFGYHLIYFSGVSDTYEWYAAAEQDYLSELSNKIENEIKERYPLEYDLTDAAIYDVMTASQAEAQ